MANTLICYILILIIVFKLRPGKGREIIDNEIFKPDPNSSISVCGFITLTNLFFFTVEASSLEIEEVEIIAHVLTDGSLKVTERRTINFSGQFRGADQKFYFSGISSYSNISLREGDLYYTPVNHFPTSEPGTFAVKTFGDEYFMIDWSFDAFNETRTFTLEYTAMDLVIAHDDVAELYYKFIGDEWEFQANRAGVTLILPAGAEESKVLAWGHGPKHGIVSIESPQRITWNVYPLPARTYLEGRVVFPLSLIPDSTRKSNRESLPEILRQEKYWAMQTNLERLACRYQLYYSLPLLFLFGLLILNKWKKANNSAGAF